MTKQFIRLRVMIRLDMTQMEEALLIYVVIQIQQVGIHTERELLGLVQTELLIQ